MSIQRIAIIGAGLAGITAARILSPHFDVVVFEKARGVSGRLANRTRHNTHFDFGAQFFTARSHAFRDHLKTLPEGLVIPWTPRFAEITGTRITQTYLWRDNPEHYIAAPKMTSWLTYLSQNLSVHLTTKITRLSREENRWRLWQDEQNLGDFDWVISAVPPAQAALFLPSEFAWFDRLTAVNMQACYALMVGLATPIELSWEAALVKEADLSWISVNHSKSQRGQAALVALATNDWADKNLATADDTVQAHLLTALTNITGALPEIRHLDLHRWRYANLKTKQQGPLAYFDPKHRLLACGDWCLQGRVEAAFLSGEYAGQILDKHLKNGGVA